MDPSIPADIQQQYDVLAAIVANATLPEAVRRPAEISMIELQRQYPALGQTPASILPAAHPVHHGTVHHDQSQTHGVVAGVIAQSTINLFFGAQPPFDGESLLKSYFDDLIEDCNRLRLERMTEKRQTGGEHATTPTLKLQDVYTNLTTDGPDILIAEQVGPIDRLRQWCEQQDLQDKPPNIYDPWQVRRIVCQDTDGTPIHHIFVKLNRTRLPVARAARQGSYDPAELFTIQVLRPELAFDAIRQQQRLVLLGEPGSGKSTVLRYLVVLLARRLQGKEVSISGWEEIDPLPIPIFCPLGQVAQALTETGDANEALWQTIGSLLDGHQPLRAGLREYLKDAINRGGVILLCDGLDELPLVSSSDAHMRPRRDIARAIQNLARTAPHLRIVLTSRVRPYHASSDWQLSHEDDWAIRTIQPLAFGQVRTFIQNWHHALTGKVDLTSAQATAARSEHLIGEIEAYPRIHPLVASPLLLTMLTILHYNTDRIPRDRAMLYHECVQLLLERWEPVRSSTNPVEERKLLARLGDIPGLRLDQLRIVLHDLAFAAHDQPPADDGRGLIDGEKFDGKLHRFFAKLRCLDVAGKIQTFREVLEGDAGLLQVPDHDRYAFPHLSFQEYLAACYLVDQMDKEQRSLAYDRWCSPDAERWREVLLLMMGRLRQEGIRQLERDGAPWLEYLLSRNIKNRAKSLYQRQRDVMLAALSYAEIEGHTTLANWDMGVEERIEGPLRAGLVALLAESALQIDFADRLVIVTVLGQLGDPRFPVTIDTWRSEAFPTTFGNSEGYWCFVPAGTYKIGGWKENKLAVDITLPQYWIARFPITVAQFRCFVEVGYHNEAERWWTPHGWAWKQKYNRVTPWGWDDATWMGYNRSVIGVSWYEAMAFVNWCNEQLTDVLPEGYQLRLPTEAEWEVAAAYDRAGHRRTYPWGEDEPTWEYAIYNESKIGRTAPLGFCSSGRAFCGALDMAGNIWEWNCSHGKRYPKESHQVVEDFEPESHDTPQRGGSQNTNSEQINCGSRSQDRPVDRGYARGGEGFRVVVSRRPV